MTLFRFLTATLRIEKQEARNPKRLLYQLFYTLFPFISFHLKSTGYITAHRLSGIVNIRFIEQEGEKRGWR